MLNDILYILNILVNFSKSTFLNYEKPLLIKNRYLKTSVEHFHN